MAAPPLRMSSNGDNAMAYQPVENTVLVEMRYTINGEDAENTLAFHCEDGVTLLNMGLLAEFVDDWWNTELRPLLGTGYVYRETYLTDLTTQTSPTLTSTANASLPGTDATGATLPGNVAFCLSFRTPNRGRSGRGRNYIAGLNEDDVTGNFLSTAKADAFRDAYSAFLSETLFPYKWVVISRQFNGVLRAEGLPQTVTTVLYTDLRVDTMRSRA